MSHIPGTVHVDRVKPGAWVLALRGEHDEAGGAGTVAAALADISRDHLVVFDLSEVTFIETMALARLLDVASRQREAGGDVWFVVEPQTFASRLFEVTGFNRMLEVFESREAAIAAVPARFC